MAYRFNFKEARDVLGRWTFSGSGSGTSHELGTMDRGRYDKVHTHMVRAAEHASAGEHGSAFTHLAQAESALGNDHPHTAISLKYAKMEQQHFAGGGNLGDAGHQSIMGERQRAIDDRNKKEFDDRLRSLKPGKANAQVLARVMKEYERGLITGEEVYQETGHRVM